MINSNSLGNKQPNRKENNKINDSEMLLWHNGGKWKERWFITCENCLIFFKDSAHCSVDFALDMRSCYLDVPDENHEQGFLSFKVCHIFSFTLLLFGCPNLESLSGIYKHFTIFSIKGTTSNVNSILLGFFLNGSDGYIKELLSCA